VLKVLKGAGGADRSARRTHSRHRQHV